MDMGLSKFQVRGKDREAWRAATAWGYKESDMTERLNSNNRNSHYLGIFSLY